MIFLCLCGNEHAGPGEGCGEGVFLPRKQFQLLAALPSVGLIMFALPALFSPSCLALPPSLQPAVSCGTRHLAATAVPTVILPATFPEVLRTGT